MGLSARRVRPEPIMASAMDPEICVAAVRGRRPTKRAPKYPASFTAGEVRLMKQWATTIASGNGPRMWYNEHARRLLGKFLRMDDSPEIVNRIVQTYIVTCDACGAQKKVHARPTTSEWEIASKARYRSLALPHPGLYCPHCVKRLIED